MDNEPVKVEESLPEKIEEKPMEFVRNAIPAQIFRTKPRKPIKPFLDKADIAFCNRIGFEYGIRPQVLKRILLRYFEECMLQKLLRLSEFKLAGIFPIKFFVTRYAHIHAGAGPRFMFFPKFIRMSFDRLKGMDHLMTNKWCLYTMNKGYKRHEYRSFIEQKYEESLKK